MQEVHQQVKTQLHDKKLKSKERYDKTIQPLITQVGEQVITHEKTNKSKLEPNWLGPCTVIETQPDSTNVKILKSNKPVTVHRNLLKRFIERN